MPSTTDRVDGCAQVENYLNRHSNTRPAQPLARSPFDMAQPPLQQQRQPQQQQQQEPLLVLPHHAAINAKLRSGNLQVGTSHKPVILLGFTA